MLNTFLVLFLICHWLITVTFVCFRFVCFLPLIQSILCYLLKFSLISLWLDASDVLSNFIITLGDCPPQIEHTYHLGVSLQHPPGDMFCLSLVPDFLFPGSCIFPYLSLCPHYFVEHIPGKGCNLFWDLALFENMLSLPFDLIDGLHENIILH